MSFLAPLYLLGALAISLPIILHLIRRSPRGRMAFSSLMFLGSSPPRVTRRSRLDHLLLLLLRSAALCLLAAAFARPFFRTEVPLLSGGGARKRLALLLDTSASMRRGDLWRQALEKVDVLLGGLDAADEVALFRFDDGLTNLVSFEDAADLPPREKIALIRRAALAAAPTWGATDLGAALVGVADAVDGIGAPAPRSDEPTTGAPAPARRPGELRIVLVSDLQRGSRLDALASYEWPKRVVLSVEKVALGVSSNAGVSVLGGGGLGGGSRDGGGLEGAVLQGGTERIRVRVDNEPDSARERLTLEWARDAGADGVGSEGPRGSGGPSPLEPENVVVPPGETRVVSIERLGGVAPPERLLLRGDDEDFDNSCYIAPSRRGTVTVLFVGADAPDDPEGMRYYVERALSGGPRRQVRFDARPLTGPLSLASSGPPRLLLAVGDAGDDVLEEILGYASSGGTVLHVLTAGSSGRACGKLLGVDGLVAEEAEGDDYAMFGEIDFSHPIFAAFADPRFSDFTKIRFWRHRRLTVAGDGPLGARVLARFDDGAPALLEKRRGEGRIFVLASGWGPSDSQLARSTKFVPLLESLLEDPEEASRQGASFLVNDPIPLPPSEDGPRKVLKPDGTEVALEPGASRFEGADLPGIYELVAASGRRRFAVNMSPQETRTSPMPPEDLEQLGVRFAARSGGEERLREARDLETESSQKLWRWLVVAALVTLILETWVAGRLADRTVPGRATSGRRGEAGPEEAVSP
jgi:hypothetical protein